MPAWRGRSASRRPEGSILNCVAPAAVNGRLQLCQRVADMILGALAQAIPERVMACSNSACIVAYFIGKQPQDGSTWVYLETIGGGSGARATKDGLDGVHVHTTNTSNLPVEALEIEYPLTLMRYELVEDSGGVGQYRGGMGLRRVYQATHDCRVRVDITRQRSQSWGLFGGGPGGHGEVEAGPGVVFDGDSAVLKPASGLPSSRRAPAASARPGGASLRPRRAIWPRVRSARRRRSGSTACPRAPESPDMTLSAAEAQTPAADRSEDGCRASTQNRSTVESCRIAFLQHLSACGIPTFGSISRRRSDPTLEPGSRSRPRIG